VVCTARVEQISFHCGRRCGHAAPDPSSLFSQGWPPDTVTGFLSEGFKTAGRFHRLCSGLERFLCQMCTTPGCCRPNRWQCVKAVPWWNSRESRSHAAQSFRASTQPFDFRTSINRARKVSPNSILHPSTRLNIYAHLLSLQRTQNPIVSEKPGVR